jgi:endonuclease/exonuclease/phosphatase family metal-dependent hydrolase
MPLSHESSMDQIFSGNFAPVRFQLWPRESFRVVDWNIDRGTQLQGILEFLREAKADLILLQEVDLNAKRTHRFDIAREIARALQLNFVFGTEFQELTQGSQQSPAYQGQATLSPWSIKNARLMRFRRQTNFWQPHWYLPHIEPFQERLGGRIALIADIELCGKTVSTYNLHLESKEDDTLRVSQLNEVLVDAGSASKTGPALIAGDLNLNAGEGEAALALERTEFRDGVGLPDVRTRPGRNVFDQGRSIDWIFLSSRLNGRNGRIHRNVRASDHFPVSAEVSFR